jgi:hypothetical protein
MTAVLLERVVLFIVFLGFLGEWPGAKLSRNRIRSSRLKRFNAFQRLRFGTIGPSQIR